MTNKIILKKSSVTSKVPTTPDLVFGELALNYADGYLYYKTDLGAIAALNEKILAGDGLSKTNSTIAVNSTVVRTTATYADPSFITSINYSKLVGTIPTWNQNTTGNAATATTLQTARTISLSGDVTGSVSFNGGSNVSITTTIAANSVALGADTTGNYVATIAGTANQVSVSGSGSETAAVTLSLPQNIHTGATPQFAGMTLSGALAMGSSKITGLGLPTDSTDATTKQYVDEVAAGLKAAPAVEVATTANLTATYNNGTLGVGATLTSTANGAFPTIDGVTVSSTTMGANGVLVKNQTNSAHNGRYNLTQIGNGSTPWILTRCGVCDEADEIPGSYVFVKAGSTLASTGWVAYVADPFTFVVGTNNIFYFQFSGVGTFTAGTGLTLTGSQFSVNASQTQVTAIGTLTTGTWNAAVIAGQYGGTGVANTGRTITLGGNLTTSGAHATTLTTTGTTGVTLPTTGTLATIAGSETLTNKTIAAASNTISGLTNSNLSGSAGITNANLANSTISGVALGSNLSTLTMGVSGTGLSGSTTYNGSGAATFTVASNATSANTVSTIVARDASGNFSAGTISAALSGNASTATSAATLTTARTINGVSFNGSANITVTSNTTNALTIGAGLSGTSFNGSGAVTIAIDSTVVTLTGIQTLTNKTIAAASNTISGLTNANLSGTAGITNANLANSSVTIGTTAIALGASSTTLAGLTSVTSTSFIGALTGNASTATTLQTARNINGVLFNGSADITISTANPNALTIGTGLSGTSYSGATAVTIALAAGYGDTLNPYASKTANFVLAAPSGVAGVPTFRALLAADIPTLNQNTTGNAATATNVAYTGLTGTIPTWNQNTTGSAATLTTGRTISITGDIAYTSGSFNGSANVTGTGTLALVGTAGTYTKVTTDAKGRVTAGTTLVAADIPGLDASKLTSGTIDAARLPSYVDDVLEFTNLAGFPVTGETGKLYVALDTNKVYRWSGTTYIFITSGAVDSVAGKTGVVTLVKADVGLGNADNTADSTKSVLEATRLTTARTIGGVSFNGTANISLPGVNAVGNQNTSGSAASLTTARTFTIGSTGKTFNGTADVAWTLAEIGAYAATNPSGYTSNVGTVTGVTGTAPIASSGGAAPVISISAATTSAAGSMSSADKTKLDGIAAGAQVNVPTNLTYSTGATTGTVNSSTGTNAIIPAATTSLAGLMTNADKTKLDGIAAGAGAGTVTGVTGTAPIISSGGSAPVISISTATTSAAGSMSSADKTKLDGIAAGAQVNVATNLGITAGTTAGPIVTSSTGTNATLPSASASASGVVTTDAQTFAGAKTFNSNVTVSGTVSVNALIIDGVTLQDYNTVTVASTAATQLSAFAAATYGSGEFLIQATQGVNRQISKILVVHNGTVADAAEFGMIQTGSRLFNVDVDISSGNVRLLVTSTTTSSTVYRTSYTLIGA